MPCISELYPAFTLDQLATLSLWSVASPMGLVVRIATDHEHFPEVAVLSRGENPQARYLMNPTSRGTVVMVRPAGGKWELPSVKTALAKVLVLEQWNVDA
jgi:hypothetical protein